jgi:hypothetical protein
MCFNDVEKCSLSSLENDEGKRKSSGCLLSGRLVALTYILKRPQCLGSGNDRSQGQELVESQEDRN